jgi:hypothetical protein
MNGDHDRRRELVAAANTLALTEIVRTTRRISSDRLYAQVCEAMDPVEYRSAIDLLKRRRLIVEENCEIRWVLPYPRRKRMNDLEKAAFAVYASLEFGPLRNHAHLIRDELKALRLALAKRTKNGYVKAEEF